MQGFECGSCNYPFCNNSISALTQLDVTGSIPILDALQRKSRKISTCSKFSLEEPSFRSNMYHGRAFLRHVEFYGTVLQSLVRTKK